MFMACWCVLKIYKRWSWMVFKIIFFGIIFIYSKYISVEKNFNIKCDVFYFVFKITILKLFIFFKCVPWTPTTASFFFPAWMVYGTRTATTTSFFLSAFFFLREWSTREREGFKQPKSLLGLAIYPPQANRQSNWRFPAPLCAAAAQSAPSLENDFCVLHP